MISGFPYKVHEVDSSRVITAHNERRNHEKKKFILQDALIHPRIFGAAGAPGVKGITGSIRARGKRQEKREQQYLQGRESKVWIMYSVAGASRRSAV
ncbi:hypothetical protein ACQKM1_12795 [Peribacillus frigoritolerans]|uniref:hypothetical protein n=1 Tax=Peribacillus frigoritolerans TaxID=450367 RepID=UPI003D077611